MPALVPELVNMASSPDISTADLLRRALVVAKRLGASELTEWISSELNGYTGDTPDYRRARGSAKVMNPYHGAIPLVMPSADWAEAISTVRIHQSIPELEHLAKSKRDLVRHYSPETEYKLMDAMDIPLRPFLSLAPVQIHGIVEKVRSKILDWALDLEARGVLGEGMTFTQQEKQTVQEQHYHFGDVSGSQIQIGSSGSNQTQANTVSNDIQALKGLVEGLERVLASVESASPVVDELKAELATLKAQAASPKPKWEVIRATARCIKTVAEGAAGNILATLAQPQMATLLGLASS